MSTKHRYPVPSSFNVNVRLCEPSGPGVCFVAPVQVSVPSFARFLLSTLSPPPILLVLICFRRITHPSPPRPLGLGLGSVGDANTQTLGVFPGHSWTGHLSSLSKISCCCKQPPSLPVTLDCGTPASSPQPFYTAGATLMAEVSQAPDPNLTSFPQP